MRDDDMNGAPLDEPLGEMARAYHRPPPVPREAMWAAIQDRLERARVADAPAAPGGDPVSDARVLPFRRPGAFRWKALGAWAAAAAALMVLGIGIGRRTAPPADGEAALAVGDAAGGGAIHAAAAEHLSRSRDLLTLVRTDARSGRIDPVVARWGRDLLVETRLLMDSSVGSDPEMKPLLEDLELILLQVALLGGEGMDEGGRAREELDIIARGMDASRMLPRIQAAVPEIPGLTGT